MRDVLGAGQGDHNRRGGKTIAHVVLDYDAGAQRALFVPNDRVQIDLHDLPAHGVCSHGSASHAARSTCSNSLRSSRLRWELAMHASASSRSNSSALISSSRCSTAVRINSLRLTPSARAASSARRSAAAGNSISTRSFKGFFAALDLTEAIRRVVPVDAIRPPSRSNYITRYISMYMDECQLNERRFARCRSEEREILFFCG